MRDLVILRPGSRLGVHEKDLGSQPSGERGLSLRDFLS
jgi:hypothetical protein